MLDTRVLRLLGWDHCGYRSGYLSVLSQPSHEVDQSVHLEDLLLHENDPESSHAARGMGQGRIDCQCTRSERLLNTVLANSQCQPYKGEGAGLYETVDCV
jgi:hypothetical protein